MTWMWRFAVGVALLACLEFPLSSPSQLRDLEKSESVRLSNENVARSQHREKRWVGLAIAAFDEFFNYITYTFGAVSVSTGEIKETLLDLEQTLATEFSKLSDTMQELRDGQKWLEGAILYAKDIENLRYILHKLNQFSVDDTGKLQPENLVQRWAESILTTTGDQSIGQILYSLHNMVTGTTSLFGNTPIVTLVNNTLDPQASDYGVKLRNFATFTYKLQMSGYLAWAKAATVMDVTDLLSQINGSVTERFQEKQQSLLISLMTAWPSGKYGIPLRQRDDTCPSSSDAWSPGALKWYSGDNIERLKFCMRTKTEKLSEEFRGEGDWPAGEYCIYQQGASCPAGFDRGSVTYKAVRERLDFIFGSTPAFEYTESFNLHYCCRTDGSTKNGIRLPPFRTFSLPRHGGHCQQILHMRVSGDRYNWYRYDRSVDGKPIGSGSHPNILKEWDFSYVPICYYEPDF